jgi:cardiolipin synthase A/B
MTVTLPWWVLALLIAAIALLLLLYWSVKHRRRPRISLTCHGDGAIDQIERSVAGLTQGTLCAGNRIDLVEDGAYFDRLLEDVAAAESTVHVESFLAKEGEVTRRLTDALVAKARQGVKVRVMLDASGGRGYGKEPLRRLRAAGVDVRFYHPLRPSTLGRLNNRDHRKLAVLDGRVGWVGGHCLVDGWLGCAEDKKHFRDISARVEGPVVSQLQAAFSENWIEETGELFAGDGCFPPLPEAGAASAHVVWLSPGGSPSSVELLYFVAIAAARQSITIQNPYFLPDPDERKALIAAAGRGVAVRVMLPATTASDAPIVQHASHHHYGSLLAGGVEIYEYQRTLLHQKVMTIDGLWSSVGSTNFDDRSFEINDEVTLAVCDPQVARELEAIFERDCEHAKRIELDQWKRRSLPHRLLDFSAYLINEQL